MSKMNVRRRQVVAKLENDSLTMQAGALQWMTGKIEVKTDVKGVGDFLGKMVKGAVTKESAIKPVYTGSGIVVLEPTYKYLILCDVGEWGNGGVTIEDGMYLASEKSVNIGITSRKSISSAILGNEGLFNVNLKGTGKVLMSPVAPTNSLVAATNSVGSKAADAKSNAFNAVGGIIGGIMGN